MNAVTIALALGIAMGCADDRARARPPRYDYRSAYIWDAACYNRSLMAILPPRLLSREEAALQLFEIRLYGLVCFADQPAFAAWLQLLEDDLVSDLDLLDIHYTEFQAAWDRATSHLKQYRPAEQFSFPLRWNELPPVRK